MHDDFFTAGGTLSTSSPSYVERRADRELRECLLRGEYCYVLTSRQMGKSSMMVRTAVALRSEGVQAVILDLTALGHQSKVKPGWLLPPCLARAVVSNQIAAWVAETWRCRSGRASYQPQPGPKMAESAS